MKRWFAAFGLAWLCAAAVSAADADPLNSVRWPDL